jgi:uncharacterized protein
MSGTLLSLIFLGIGLLIGFMAQRSRMCFVAGLRDWILVRDGELLLGLFSFLATVWVLTSVLGAVGLLHTGAPEYGGAQAARVRAAAAGLPPLRSLINAFFLASLAGGLLVGALSVAAGGCVMRQHVLAAQGDRNALFFLAGFYVAVLAYYLLLYRFFEWVYR